MRTPREVLLVSARFLSCALAVSSSGLWVPDAAQPPRRIVIHSAPLDTLGDYGRGVRLGASEAERAAMLLGHEFALVHDGPALARVAPMAPSSADVPVVAMNGTPNDRCVFVTASALFGGSDRAGAGDPRLIITDWHHEFRRYGAGELNERFEKTFARPMTADAWHGWVAIKAIVEAAIRGEDLCAELFRLRFDGHKGRVLSFDPQTRRLRHPRLSVRIEREKPIVEVVP